jgi:Ca2+-binding EF-hand superfamily protein
MNISSNSLYEVSAYASYGSNSSSSTSSMSSKFAEELLTSMDSDSSGSIDSAEFSTAALSLSSSNTESDAAATFSALDTDQDGVVSIDELTSSIESILGQQGTMAAGGPPPPPPPSSSSDSEEDTGYTQEELSAMATSTSSTDSVLSSLFDTLSNNFDTADSNGDGKVTSQEAMAYQEATQEASVGTNQQKDDTMMKNLLAQIISSYSTQSSAQASTLSLSA